MKTRVGFVSNSSSSSFIIGDGKHINHLGFDDWYDMLTDLYPDYDNVVAKHRKRIMEEPWSDSPYPFAIFDLSTERKQASQVLNHLDGWKATNCVMHNGELKKVKTNPGERWHNFLQKKEDEIEKRYSDNLNCFVNIAYPGLDNMENLRKGKIMVQISDYSTNTSISKTKSIQLPDCEIKAILDKYDKIGICTNMDVLMNKKAKFAFHFSENEYCAIQGVTSVGAEWETEEYTYERLCEVMAKWLVAHNKVDSNFSYKDLLDATLTVTMHEG